MGAQLHTAPPAQGVSVRPLEERDLDGADRIFRLAFGTFLGLPDPMSFFEGADYVRGRWVADPSAAFAAQLDGELVGTNFATNWGSVAFFGPLTVQPDHWDRGIAQRLMEPVIELFASWGIRHAGLFTFSHSPKHVALYQKYGFWPRFLTAIMAKPISGGGSDVRWSRYSELPEAEQERRLDACRELTSGIYDGLDVAREIGAVVTQGTGEVVLLDDGDELAGFAVCHGGAGSEAETGTGFVKFAAARAGSGAAGRFERLLDACEAFAADRGLSRLDVGMNLGRDDAYRRLVGRGYRTWLQGVAMQRPNEPGYSRPDVYVIEDWR